MLHALESRLLFAGVTVGFRSGLLTVNGTAGADSIEIFVTPQGVVSVRDSNDVIYTSTDAGDVVRQLKAHGRDGDDSIILSNRRSTVRAILWGDAGEDLVISNSERAPAAALFG